MDHDGIKALNISGIDYLKKYYVSHANGDEEVVEEPADADEEVMDEEPTDVVEEDVIEEEVYEGPSISDILDKTPVGILLGVGLGIIILSGVSG